MSRAFRAALTILSLALLFVTPRTASAQRAETGTFDLLISGGKVLDGSGNPWFYADIGIRDGRIAALGNFSAATASRTIDARGLTITPGFIDIHSHADDGSAEDGEGTLRDANDPRRRAAPNLVMQGITTVVVNQDGRSVWPIAGQRETMERLGIGPNAILLIGHGAVRGRAMGRDVQRAATDEEIARMRALVRQGMQEGAFGLSAGLEYSPGRWSTTDEVVALAEEIAPFRGVYISHERSEGADPMWFWPSQHEPGPPTLIDAIQETIEIGERTGAIVVASHIKAKGAHYWGTSGAAIQLIESARARGVEVYADQYPYDTSGSDGSTVLIPGWALQGEQGQRGGRGEDVDYAERLRTALADPAGAARLRGDIAHEIRRRGGEAKVLIFDYPDSSYVGKSLGELADMRGLNRVEMAIALQLEGYANRRGGARVRGFSLSDLDIEAYAARPWVATATDGGIALPDDGASTHARFYGTFPRKIRYYAIERGALSVDDAIRSATGLPAQILGLHDRGTIRVGAVADLVIMDLETIRDRATFFEPHQYPEGVHHVLINGQSVVEDGRPTGALPGKVLTIQQYRGGRGATPATSF